MKSQSLWFLAIALACLMTTTPCISQKREPIPEDELSQWRQQQDVTPMCVTLNAYGKTQLTHDMHEPLLLMVSVANCEATRVLNENLDAERHLVVYREKGLLDAMDSEHRKNFIERNQPKAVPVITISEPIKTLITFQLTKDGKREVPVLVRPLAVSSQEKVPHVLDGKESVGLYFGVDPEVLAPGKYELTAVLDTIDRKSTWQGRASSEAVIMTVQANAERNKTEDQNYWDYLYGRFYVLDEKPEKIDMYVKRLVARDKESVSAYELRGDALLAQGKLELAQDAFTKALQYFYAKPPNKYDEPPAYLYRRLELIQELLTARSKGIE